MALVGSITYLRSYVYICPLFVCYNFIKRQGSYTSFAPVPVFVSALYLSLLGFYFPLRKPESYRSVEPKNIIRHKTCYSQIFLVRRRMRLDLGHRELLTIITNFLLLIVCHDISGNRKSIVYSMSYTKKVMLYCKIYLFCNYLFFENYNYPNSW